MKIAVAAILALPVASAFVNTASLRTFGTRLSAVVTGPSGKAAKSAEEDLMLTLKIIMDHQERSTTASKDQFVAQMTEAQKEPVVEVESVDISIPYDAPAALSYEASDKSMTYADFKVKYEADAVADVISKRRVVEKEPDVEPVDISIPYDAPAALAYEASDKSIAYADFKLKYEADAVADVMSKQPIDVSIPYDAPARLAYEASDKSMSYADFKQKYEDDAVADIISKKAGAEKKEPVAVTIDISIPYDAAAALAYEASDKSMAYADFKVQYEAEAVAHVISKKPFDLSIPYDAPAKLAYEHSDKSMAYADFKKKYEDDAVADVVAKKSKD
jgi:hypothetical protein